MDSDERTVGGIEQVYGRFRRLMERPDVIDPAALHAILLDPLSQEKLDSACASVLKGSARRSDLMSDIQQEAFSIVLSRFRDGKVPFCDEGASHFCGWLWTLWHHACRKALKREPAALSPLPPGDLECRIQETQHPAFRSLRWHTALAAIDRLDEPLREALLDWLDGQSCESSARRRGVSRTTISRRRRQAVAAVRRMIADSPSSDQSPCG